MSGKRKSQNITKGQGDRKYSGARPERKGTDGSGKAAINAATTGEPQLSVLMNDVKSIPLMFFHMHDAESPYSKLLEKVSTEKAMLQAIEDLYLIVKAQRQYKNLKDDKWKESTEPMEILLWLLRKLGPLAKGNSWTIDTYMDGKKERFRFVIYRHFSGSGFGGGFKHGSKHLSCDFLPFLINRDRPLHDMIIDALALVSKYCRIPLWDEDGDFSSAMDKLKGITSVNEVMVGYQDMYRNGVASQYLKLIKARRRSVSIQDLNTHLMKYDDDSQRKRWICRWLKNVFILIRDKQSIDEFTYIPNYEQLKSPVSPFRQYKIVWSIHPNDPVSNWAGDKLEKDKNSQGEYDPVDYSITLPGKICKPLNRDNSNFPVNLSNWMNDAISIFMSAYRDYFYKSMLENKNAPGITLLEKIELMEFKQLLNER